MGTVAANPTLPSSSSCGVKLESLTLIDITKLSQSELQALSMCSNSALDLRSTDDAVLPRIDRTVFNESAGSRRQTYSRIRGGFHQHHRTRLPGLLPGPKLPPASDPENHSILYYLKHYVNYNSSSNCPPPPPPPPPPAAPPSPSPQPVVLADLQQQLGLGLQEKMSIAVHAAETKRKRGRKAKVKVNRILLENGAGMELERVNKKGEEVDFASLESNGDDLYSGELEKLTTGLETEEEVLEVLRGLEGQWGSRRKRRKYVDACMFGDALPIGWQLLLGLRRRDGRVSIYCRRIISPSGEQFLSCKEASSFLHSYFEGKDSNRPMDQGKCIIEQANRVASGSTAGFVGSDSTVAPLTTSDAHENKVCLMEIDNLPEVQVQDIFECYKCNLTFHEKNAYLKHLMSVHERTTRRYKFGASIGEGVIIKDGKFECQFCHKVFLERRSYNGHVGVHVRNHGKGSEELPAPGSVQKSTESPSVEGSHTRTSKMNALIEIARNSMVATSSAGFNSEPADNSCPSMMNLNEALVDNDNAGTILGSDPVQIEMGDLESDRSLDQVVNEGGTECMVDDGEMVKRDDRQVVSMHLKSTCTNVSEHTNSKELEKYGNNDIDTGHGLGLAELSDDVANSKGLIGEENFSQIAVTSSLHPLEPSLQYFPDVANKGDDDFLSVHQNLEKVTSFEELGFDEIEPFKYGFVDKQESSSLRVCMDLANDAGTEEGFNSSVGFDTEAIISDMAGMHQVTTVCVWCRADFKVEAFDTETQSDTIGYMCPTCKDKISGHFDRICPSEGW